MGQPGPNEAIRCTQCGGIAESLAQKYAGCEGCQTRYTLARSEILPPSLTNFHTTTHHRPRFQQGTASLRTIKIDLFGHPFQISSDSVFGKAYEAAPSKKKELLKELHQQLLETCTSLGSTGIINRIREIFPTEYLDKNGFVYTKPATDHAFYRGRPYANGDPQASVNLDILRTMAKDLFGIAVPEKVRESREAVTGVDLPPHLTLVPENKLYLSAAKVMARRRQSDKIEVIQLEPNLDALLKMQPPTPERQPDDASTPEHAENDIEVLQPSEAQ
jgi:hypothetical protein